MSTKPAVLPRYAINIAGDTFAANVAEPTSGQKDTGTTPSQLADSSFDNWLKAVTYMWMLYLSDGYLDVVDVYHGEQCLPIGIETAVQTGGTIAKTFTGTSDGDYLEATGSSEARFPIPGIKSGDRILRVVVELYGSASGNASLSIGGQRVDGVTTGGREAFVAPANNGASPPGGGSTGAFVTTTDTIGTLWAKRTHGLGAAGVGYVVGSGGDLTTEETLYVAVAVPTTWRIGGVFVYFDRPRP